MLRSGSSASSSALWYSSPLAESLSLSKTITRFARERPNSSIIKSCTRSESPPEPSNPLPLAGRRASARKEPPSPTPRPRTIGSAIGGGRQTGPTAQTGSTEPTFSTRFFHASIVTDTPYVIWKECDLRSLPHSPHRRPDYHQSVVAMPLDDLVPELSIWLLRGQQVLAEASPWTS